MDFKDVLMSEKQIESFAYAIYEDVNQYIDTDSEEYNHWFLCEIVTDAINETKDIKNKMKNQYD